MWQCHRADLSAASQPADIQHAVSQLTRCLRDGHPALAPYFDVCKSLIAARAPGRLDVMGGIADYSGSTVLQLPLSESAVVLCQLTLESVVRVISASFDGEEHRTFCMPLSDFFDSANGNPCSLSRMRDHFRGMPENQQWAAYIAGVIPVLMNDGDLRLDQGMVFYVYSTVPEGKGVSSSAAIEVSAMRAVTQALDLKIDVQRQAVLCQRVENHVVGAPCGLMDQMTSSVGQQNSLLTLLCQPDCVQDPVQLPAGLAVWGIDSGLQHAVSGSDYTSVRVGTFMGYRLILEQAGIAAAHVPATEIVDDRWQGYLANVSVSEFTGQFESLLPLTLSGADFLERFDDTTDSVTRIDQSTYYAVRVCAAHPVHEHFRVRLFAHLSSQSADNVVRTAASHLMGECMYQSHASYSSCGIGSDGTDDLVARLQRAGSDNGVYGARITGGGSGGTVAVLANIEAGDLIRTIAADYARETGIGGQVFSGSSDGASARHLEPIIP